jgi:uncharacterized damage-inducible protein DinB
MTDGSEFRTIPGGALDERASLDAYLDFHRGTLLWKCSGLTDAQLVTASCPPSNLTLLGLVRHLTEVESGWFGTLDGAAQKRYSSDEEPEGDFELLDDHSVEQVLAAYRAECDRSRAALAALPLDYVRERPGRQPRSLRWIYLHMLEEYARHNGHADLLREAIDGAVGE